MLSVGSVGWWPGALARACVRQPLSQPVPADDLAFLARKGTLKLAVRTARRQLLLGLSGQWRLQQPRIAPAWRRALWIHEGMPQLGDAMMDLAPRSLLAEHGLAQDLFAPPHIAALFAGDPCFQRTLCRPDDLHAGNYDFVIVLGNDRKCWRLKRERLADLPWVSLHGFYGGPDFHRARFATRRLGDLLGLTLDDAALAAHSAQKLRLDDTASRWAAELVGALPSVALALGGVHFERTYHRWPGVVDCLVERGVPQLLLLGSANGRALADELGAVAAGRVRIIDVVGHADLHQTHALLATARVAVCADGGLMHLALATRAPVVSLFTATIDPQWRLPVAHGGTSLVSASGSVDDIAPQSIADAALSVLSQAVHPTP